MSDSGRIFESVIVLSRRYDPLSSRLLVKLFGPTWFGFSPIRGYFASGLAGVQRLIQRSTEMFARGDASVRILLTFRIFPPCEPCSNPVSSNPAILTVLVQPYVKSGVGSPMIVRSFSVI